MIGIKQFTERYSFGKYFIFDNANRCFILSDEEYDDFVAIIRCENSVVEMYDGNTQLSVELTDIQNILHRLQDKTKQSILTSFNLDSDSVGQIKTLCKKYTHIEFTTDDDIVILRFFDYRHLIQDKDDDFVFNLGVQRTQSFQKIINVKTFVKFIKRQNYTVNISSGDFVEFESEKDSVSLIFQTQLKT